VNPNHSLGDRKTENGNGFFRDIIKLAAIFRVNSWNKTALDPIGFRLDRERRATIEQGSITWRCVRERVIRADRLGGFPGDSNQDDQSLPANGRFGLGEPPGAINVSTVRETAARCSADRRSSRRAIFGKRTRK